MNKSWKLFMILVSCITIVSCNNNKEEISPYNDILDKQPFAPLTDSIKIAPKNDDLLFRRAVLLNKNNFPEPALADFRKAWSIKKDERYALGISRILMEKRTDSALSFLNTALQEFPHSLLLKLNLARVYDQMGDSERSMHTTREILAEHPEQVDVLKMQAELLDRLEKPDSAIKVLEKAYQLTPFDIDLNYSLAYKYAETKNPKVIALCDSLIRIDSLNA